MFTHIQKLMAVVFLALVAVMAAVTNAHAVPVVAGGNFSFETLGTNFNNGGQTSAAGDAGYISSNGGNMPSGWQGGNIGGGASSTPSTDWGWGVGSTGQLPDSVAQHGLWNKPVPPIGSGSDGGSGAFHDNYFGWFYTYRGTPGDTTGRFIEATVTGLTMGAQYTTSFLYNTVLGPASGALGGNAARDQVAIELLMDGTVIWNSGLYVSSSGNNDYSTPFHSMTSIPWTATGMTATLTIRTDTDYAFVLGGSPGANQQDSDGVVLIDKVEVFEVVDPVPEPSTYALGLVGLAGLGLVVWRRRRRG